MWRRVRVDVWLCVCVCARAWACVCVTLRSVLQGMFSLLYGMCSVLYANLFGIKHPISLSHRGDVGATSRVYMCGDGGRRRRTATHVLRGGLHLKVPGAVQPCQTQVVNGRAARVGRRPTRVALNEVRWETDAARAPPSLLFANKH